MAGTRTNRVSIYRVSNNALFDSLDLSNRRYREEFTDEHTRLFVKVGSRSVPAWVSYLGSLITHPDRILNTTSSFVMLKKHNGYLYALTGGYGYAEIKEYVEDDFGVALALRMIDEKQISLLKQRSLKGAVRQIQRAVSGYQPVLDPENYNRVLDGLEGKVSFESREFRISGRSAVVLRTARPIEQLGEVLDELENILEQEPRIELPRSYEVVTDEGVVAILNGRLLQTMREFWQGNADRDQMFLEFSDPVVQFRCVTFEVKYDRRRIATEEFDLELVRDALKERGAREPDSQEALAKLRVSGVNEFGAKEFKEVPFSKLIVYETVLNNRHYIRFANKWYAILDDVQAFLDRELSALRIDRELLPSWDRSQHPSEDLYNRWVSGRTGWHCLDRDLVPINGSRIELCDLYDEDSHSFLHVKRAWGSKTAYLFSQGALAAEFYYSSEVFRAACEEKWPGVVPQTPGSPTFVFGIADMKACNDEFPFNLTYFGKLACYNAAASLRAKGFSVVLAPIQVE